MTSPQPALLLVANWDSNAGYAWWLMESFWEVLAQRYSDTHRVFLAYPSISSLPAAIQRAPINSVVLNFNTRSVRAICRQLDFIIRNRVKCIYFSDRSSADWLYLLYRLAGVNAIITHDHTPGERNPPTGIKRYLKKLVQRVPLLCADGLVAATHYVHQRHLDVVCAPAHKCHVAPNGLPVRPSVSGLDLNSTFGIPKNRVVMVTTSRAHVYKGIEFAIRLTSMLVQVHGHRNFHYLFCGDGPHLNQFRALAESLGIQDHVTFAGHRTDVRSILPSCSFAIHPSEGEVGYSLSILEYMEADLPVLVPDNPSVSEATEDRVTGFRYRDRDLSAAAECIEKLILDPDLRETYGANARSSVTSTYTLDRAHQGLLRALQSCDPLFPAA